MARGNFIPTNCRGNFIPTQWYGNCISEHCHWNLIPINLFKNICSQGHSWESYSNNYLWEQNILSPRVHLIGSHERLCFYTLYNVADEEQPVHRMHLGVKHFLITPEQTILSQYPPWLLISQLAVSPLLHQDTSGEITLYHCTFIHFILLRVCNASDSLSYLFFCTKKMKMFHDEQYLLSWNTCVLY